MAMWDQWKFVFLWLLYYLQHSFGSQQCQISVNNSLVPPCSDCNKAKSNDQHIQGYEGIDVTSSISGCFVKEISSNYNKKGILVYEETHVLNVVNGSINKVILAIKDTTIPQSMYTSARPLYSFVLLSTNPIEWLVSYNGSGDYKFYTTMHSVVKLHSTGQTVKSETTGFSTTMESGRRYHPIQIKSKVCSKTLKLPSCRVASFLQIQNLDVMELIVGKTNDTDEKETKCQLDPLRQIEQEDRVKALLLALTPPAHACSEKIATPSNYLFVIQMANLTRNAAVLLELNGLSTLVADETVHIVLHSNMPVEWRPYVNSGRDISANINFMVSHGSDVDMSELTFTDSKGGAQKKVFSHMVPEGKTLLDTVGRIFNISVTSYAVYNNQPRMLKILFRDNDVTAPWKPVKKITKQLLLVLEMGMRITAWGSQLRISTGMMTEHRIEASDVVVGDGSCGYHVDDSLVTYEDLSKCGLNRVSIDVFNINVTVKDRVGILWNQFPITTPNIKILQALNKDEISYPQKVDDKTQLFLVEVAATSNRKYGVYSKLDHCYLNSVNSSRRIKLIEDSQPANQWVSLLAPYQVSPNTRYKTFLLSLHGRDLLETDHLYNVTCVLSRCFTAENFSQVSNLLPQCLGDIQVRRDSSATLNHREKAKYTETVSANSFVFVSGNKSKSTPPSSTPVSDGALCTTVVPSQSTSALDIVTFIPSFVVGFVIGALLILIIFSLRSYRKHSRIKKEYYSSVLKLERNELKRDEVCVELLETKPALRDAVMVGLVDPKHCISLPSSDITHGSVPKLAYSSESSRSGSDQNSNTSATDETNLINSSPNATDSENGDIAPLANADLQAGKIS